MTYASYATDWPDAPFEGTTPWGSGSPVGCQRVDRHQRPRASGALCTETIRV